MDTCKLCSKTFDVNDEKVTCESCDASYHEQELASRLQDDLSCSQCGSEFDPYLSFELSDKYDLKVTHQTYSKRSGFLLNGVFGLFPPKLTISLIALTFASVLIAALLNVL